MGRRPSLSRPTRPQARFAVRVQPIGTLLVIPLLTSCSAPATTTDFTPPPRTPRDILVRLVERYDKIDTCRARGALRDYRDDSASVTQVAVDFARPGRLRFQFGMNLALIADGAWWTYADRDGYFRETRVFTHTPLATAATLLSHGAPFLLPALLEEGRRTPVFGSGKRLSGWTNLPPGWKYGVPCYVIRRRHPRGMPGSVLTLWIDQDRYLLRAWAVHDELDDGRLIPVIECDYAELAVNTAIPPNRFRLARPRPIPPLADADGAADPS
ncbi:MAG: hypothetical protein ACE5F9_03895 [Phycisphaerae bacterium]